MGVVSTVLQTLGARLWWGVIGRFLPCYEKASSKSDAREYCLVVEYICFRLFGKVWGASHSVHFCLLIFESSLCFFWTLAKPGWIMRLDNVLDSVMTGIVY